MTTNNEQNLPSSNSKPKDFTNFVTIIKLLNFGDSRFDYGDVQLGFWAERIALKYPKLNEKTLKEIICNGADGKWDDKYNQHTKLSTIMKWIEATKIEIDAKIAAEEKSIFDEARNINFETGIDLNTCIEEVRKQRNKPKE